MPFKYKNLSFGYVGRKIKNASLNSQFYALFFEMISVSCNLEKIIIFPQRIPRRDFFIELNNIETKQFRKDFNQITQHYQNIHNESLKSFVQDLSENNVRNYLSWSNLLLRYGCFEQIIKFSPKDYSGPFELEVRLLREIAKIELLLSKYNHISIEQQLELFDYYIDHTLTSDREKLILSNHIIVNYYRHQTKNSSKKITQISRVLLEKAASFETNKFINKFYCSVAYRGLALVKEFGLEQQKSFLHKAEKLARNISANTNMEEIVGRDNLFTCLQSIAKWHIYQNEQEQAENCLKELVLIDPYDSTSHSELGFLYLNMKSFNKALGCFLKALTLGPPSAGMNAYYYAKCLEKLGKESEAIHYLYESTKLDNQGLSAWLDLLTYYFNQKQMKDARNIASHIKNSPILFEQLENDEIITIQNILD